MRSWFGSALIGTVGGAFIYMSGLVPVDYVPVFLIAALILGALTFRGRQ